MTSVKMEDSVLENPVKEDHVQFLPFREQSIVNLLIP